MDLTPFPLKSMRTFQFTLIGTGSGPLLFPSEGSQYSLSGSQQQHRWEHALYSLWKIPSASDLGHTKFCHQPYGSLSFTCFCIHDPIHQNENAAAFNALQLSGLFSFPLHILTYVPKTDVFRSRPP